MLLVSFATLFALSAAAKLPGTYIVDGEVAEKWEKKYQLSLQLDGSHICGAVAISETIVLTAAHCVDFPGYDASRFSFVCGLHDILNDEGQRAYAQTITKHENYNANGLGFPNDIAVIEVFPPFVFDELCDKANLPPNNNKDYAKKDSVISGWGRKYGDGPLPTLLKKAHIPTITNIDCGRSYDLLGGLIKVIQPFHICVKDPNEEQGACNGDSGGPLTTPDFTTDRDKVTGLTSFGKAGCDTSSPSVYTRVSYYIDWINAHAAALTANRS